MKQIPSLVILFFFIISSSASSQPDSIDLFARYGVFDMDSIKPEEYRQRRAAVRSLMDSGSVALFRSHDLDLRNGDTEYRFRQNDNFLYLTGCNETNCTLILAPGGIQLESAVVVNEVLFINEHSKGWGGSTMGVEGAQRVLGFGTTGTRSIVLKADNLREILPPILKMYDLLYYSPPQPEFLFDPISNIKFVTAREVKRGLETQYPKLTIKSSGSLVNELRSVKSPAEITLLQKAIDATVSGCAEAMTICKPGMYEYELQAVIECAFTSKGCEYVGFPSIVGSGPNALSFHYDANRRKMKNGELIVMDLGAEYHGYSADVTRTIPVNGIFSPEQKELYELVLKAQASAMEEVRPNGAMNAAGKKAMEILGEGLMKLGIIQDKKDTKKYCPHGISHFIGLDVHDVGSTTKLVPGMIFTVEPGIYIPDGSSCDKKYWGIGIRIEDDVLVTEHGYRIMSDAAPRTPEGIERVMRNNNK
jgi:Xaa-Pro aminopeptidase